MSRAVEVFADEHRVVLNPPWCFDYAAARFYLGVFIGARMDYLKVEVNLRGTQELTTPAFGFLVWLEDKLNRANGRLVVKEVGGDLVALIHSANLEHLLDAKSGQPKSARLNAA